MRRTLTKASTVFCMAILCIYASVTSCQNDDLPVAKAASQQARPSPEEYTDEGRTFMASSLEQEMTEGKNIVWSAVLQLAWNELQGLAGGIITMEGSPELTDVLNRQSAKKADLNLDQESYIAVAGLLDDKLFQNVRRQASETLAARVLSDLGTLPQGSLAAYAYLVKQLPFEWAFERFDQPLQFGDDDVTVFGLKQYLENRPKDQAVAKQVVILDYQSDDDFIMELLTTSQTDRLILAKAPPAATLKATIHSVQERIAQGTPDHVRNLESVIIPVINIDRVNQYPEVCGRRIQAEHDAVNGKSLSSLTQRIRFTLDERGANLDAQAMAFSARSPRQFIFDRPFLVFLIRQGAVLPYFAVWVGNSELLTPFQ